MHNDEWNAKEEQLTNNDNHGECIRKACSLLNANRKKELCSIDIISVSYDGNLLHSIHCDVNVGGEFSSIDFPPDWISDAALFLMHVPFIHLSHSHALPLPLQSAYSHCNGKSFPPILCAGSSTWNAFQLHLNSIKYFYYEFAILVFELRFVHVPTPWKNLLQQQKSANKKHPINNRKKCHLLQSFGKKKKKHRLHK